MAINPLYAKALAKQNGEGSDDRPKYPSFHFLNIGDRVVGTVDRLSDPFETTNDYPDGQRTITNVVVELGNATVTRAAEEGEDPVVEKFDKLNVWLNKSGHFAAVGAACMAAEVEDIVVGGQFGIKWTGLGPQQKKGSRPHKFSVKISK